MNGQQLICPLMTKNMLAIGEDEVVSNATKRALASFTPRQRKVLQLIAEGEGPKRSPLC